MTALRIHHLNCGTMCPLGGRLMDGVSPVLGRAKLVCHCLLIETDRGLVLIDTGIGLHDVRAPMPRLSRVFVDMLSVQMRPEDTAIRQIERLGFAAGDVRHIVLTHLDFDHAGGLEDFPDATVHVFRAEAEAADHRTSALARRRYRPLQWGDRRNWRLYEEGGEPWFGFGTVRDLAGLPPEILMVPLIGHTWGHCGIAVRTGEGWLLHAGDAYFFRKEMDTDHPSCTPGLRAYQRMMEVDRASRLANQNRLRDLIRGQAGAVAVLSAHDRVELERWQRASSMPGSVPGGH